MVFNKMVKGGVLIGALMAALLSMPVLAAEEPILIPISEYIKLGKEPFKVNLSGKGDHVMVLLAQAYVTTQRAKDGMMLHMPKIENDVLELLGEQTYKSMKRVKHKKKLRKKILKIIRNVLNSREVPGGEEITEVIFTQVLLQ